MSRLFKAAIFDMDGVLADTEPFYQEIERRLFRQLNLDISLPEHETFKGVAADRMWITLKEKFRLNQSVTELVELTTFEVLPYFRSLKIIIPYPGVTWLIETFNEKGIPMALASSSYPEVITIILEKTGLQQYFNVVVNSHMAGTSKPDPEIYFLAAEKLRVKPFECIVIEDSANGIKAAKDAGMYCVAVDFPGNRGQDKSKADLLVTNYNQLTESLKFEKNNDSVFFCLH